MIKRLVLIFITTIFLVACNTIEEDIKVKEETLDLQIEFYKLLDEKEYIKAFDLLSTDDSINHSYAEYLLADTKDLELANLILKYDKDNMIANNLLFEPSVEEKKLTEEKKRIIEANTEYDKYLNDLIEKVNPSDFDEVKELYNNMLEKGSLYQTKNIPVYSKEKEELISELYYYYTLSKRPDRLIKLSNYLNIDKWIVLNFPSIKGQENNLEKLGTVLMLDLGKEVIITSERAFLSIRGVMYIDNIGEKYDSKETIVKRFEVGNYKVVLKDSDKYLGHVINKSTKFRFVLDTVIYDNGEVWVNK